MAPASDGESPASGSDELVVTRTVHLERRLVWRLWTEPRHLAAWWGPHGFTSPECSIEAMSMTLDGYVGGPGGEVDWIMRTLDAEATAWIEETLWQAGAHLVRRRTYADMVAYWPTSTEPLAAPMNAIPKIVFSRSGRLASEPTTALRNATEAQLEAGSPLSADGANWDDTQTLSGELGPRITALKAEPGKDLLAHGGASFAQGLVRQGLVDEYRLLLPAVRARTVRAIG